MESGKSLQGHPMSEIARNQKDMLQDRDSSEAKQDGPTIHNGRRRSLSVATGMPKIETVVVKAKRAASTLYTLLHAQNCVFADKCPNSGCREAKLLHLHVKTCSAEGGTGPCPVNHHGCEQARKLMAHYRRCRSIRAKQSDLSRKDGNPQHVCLVCSMMARQARNTFGKTSSPTKPSRGKIISSFTLNTNDEVIPLGDDRMAPPPPKIMSSSTDRFDNPNSVTRTRSASTSDSKPPACGAEEYRARSASLGNHFALFGHCETVEEESVQVEEKSE